MNKTTINIIYVLAMVSTVVLVDILFFRHKFWERLVANVGIILVYVAFYFSFIKNR
ncbi:MAG: hypothetical protein M1554_01935 [Patescibacteria group bacterium]|nr:hypothetical protein [Patescibacteria group bacterium]